MNEELKKCKIEDCPRMAISFSEYCGEHSDSEEITEALEKSSGKELESIYLCATTIEGIELKDIVFKSFEFLEIAFFEVKFINCKFLFSLNFESISFEACEFYDCYFEENTIVNGEFRYCTFTNTEFNDGTIQSTRFLGNNIEEIKDFDNLIFNKIGFQEFYFEEILGVNLSIIDSTITRSNFQYSSLKDSLIKDSTSNDTTYLDCSFKGSTFDNFISDFYPNNPMLCDFYQVKFIDSEFEHLSPEWNNFDSDDRIEFYYKCLNKILDTFDILKVNELSSIIKKLLDQKQYQGIEKQKIFQFYKNLFVQCQDKKQYAQLGEVFLTLMQISQSYTDNDLNFVPFDLLENKSKKESHQENKVIVKITFDTDDLSFSELSKLVLAQEKFFNLLEQVTGNKIVIKELGVGSYIFELVMDFVQAFLAGDFLGLQKTFIEIENQKLTKEILEQELGHLDEVHRLDILEKFEQIKNMQLQNLESSKRMEILEEQLSTQKIEHQIKQEELKAKQLDNLIKALNYAELLEARGISFDHKKFLETDLSKQLKSEAQKLKDCSDIRSTEYKLKAIGAYSDIQNMR